MVEFLRYLRKLEEESGISIASFGHAGDGNFHVNLLFKEGEEERPNLSGKTFKKGP